MALTKLDFVGICGLCPIIILSVLDDFPWSAHLSPCRSLARSRANRQREVLVTARVLPVTLWGNKSASCPTLQGSCCETGGLKVSVPLGYWKLGSEGVRGGTESLANGHAG